MASRPMGVWTKPPSKTMCLVSLSSVHRFYRVQGTKRLSRARRRYGDTRLRRLRCLRVKAWLAAFLSAQLHLGLAIFDYPGRSQASGADHAIFLSTAPIALILLPWAAHGRLAELVRRWKPLTLYTAAEIGIPGLMVFKAEERLSSSLTAVFLASVPLIGVLLARLSHDKERFSPRQLGGLLLGIIGVFVLVGVDARGVATWPVVAVFVAATGYAVGPRVLRQILSDLPGPAVTVASFGVRHRLCAVRPVQPSFTPVGRGDLGSLWLCACSYTGRLPRLLLPLIGEIGPVRTTIVFYITPAVALMLGIVVLGEPFKLGMGVGFALVIAGSILPHTRVRTLPDHRHCTH